MLAARLVAEKLAGKVLAAALGTPKLSMAAGSTQDLANEFLRSKTRRQHTCHRTASLDGPCRRLRALPKCVPRMRATRARSECMP